MGMMDTFKMVNKEKEFVAKHYAKLLNQESKVLYLQGIAAVAGIDEDMNEKEIETFRSICKQILLEDESVITQLINESDNFNSETLTELLKVVDRENLEVSLLVDAIVVCTADGAINESESELLNLICDLIDFSKTELELFIKSIEGLQKNDISTLMTFVTITGLKGHTLEYLLEILELNHLVLEGMADADALSLLGTLYNRGITVKKNREKAQGYLRSSLELTRTPYAMYELGRSLYYSDGAKNEGTKILDKVANSGSLLALKFLGSELMFQESTNHAERILKSLRSNRQVKENYLPSKAVDYLKRAIDLGEFSSRHDLADRYVNKGDEEELVENYLKAFDLYDKGVHMGCSQCLRGMSKLLAYGKGVNKSPEKAMELLIKSAKKFNFTSMYELSRHYEKGKLVEKNDKLAAIWCIKAAELGHNRSIKRLMSLHEAGNRFISENCNIADYKYKI